MKLYEGMFLLNTNDCVRNWEEVKNAAEETITREGGKIVLSQKFDDAKLAYEVAGHKRATLYLLHFEAQGDAVANIRQRAGLIEAILRAMILVDEDGAVEIEASILEPPQRRDSRGPRRPDERHREPRPAPRGDRERTDAIRHETNRQGE